MYRCLLKNHNCHALDADVPANIRSEVTYPGLFLLKQQKLLLFSCDEELTEG